MGSGDLQIATLLFAYRGDLEITTTGKRIDGPVRSSEAVKWAAATGVIFGPCGICRSNKAYSERIFLQRVDS